MTSSSLLRALLLVFLIITVPARGAMAQSHHWPAQVCNGFARPLRGEKLDYHSPMPSVTTSLLVRSINATGDIAWITGPCPVWPAMEPAHFVWMFGIDVNEERHSWDLSIDGTVVLRFTNPAMSLTGSWTVEGTSGCSLTFHATMVDRHQDLMGFAVLTVAPPLLRPGQPLRIGVTGESAGSRVWYMTFETPVEEGVDVVPQNALLRSTGEPRQPVQLRFLHLGDPVTATVTLAPDITQTLSLQPGYSSLDLAVPRVSTTTGCEAVVRLDDGRTFRRAFTLAPVRPRTVRFVQHTHTDIGYTRPQTEILPEHLRYIDYALDYCDATDSLPDDARFRWTCETSWAVREWLAARPHAQIDRLLRRVREGRIEVTGLFLNLSDLCDEPALAASLQPLRAFHAAGIPVTTAMQNDVNGVGWALAEWLGDAGITSLIMGQNVHRARKPFILPTAFQWEAPSGRRLMVWRGEHYMTGNDLGLIRPDVREFETAVHAYLAKLDADGYPWDDIAVQFGGYMTDNSPPSTTACERVRLWNGKYLTPRLRLAIAREFPDSLRAHHADALPVVRGAWPDWWMDGFGSAANETAAARETHTDLIATMGLQSMATLAGLAHPERMAATTAAVNDALLFYDEHTFGAAESISDPTCANSVIQWSEKATYAWEAVKRTRMLREDAMGWIQDLLPRADEPLLAVFNTLNWTRSGPVTVYIDHQIIPRGCAFSIIDAHGEPLPVQEQGARQDGTFWTIWARDIPPMGHATFRIRVKPETTPVGAAPLAPEGPASSHYRIVIDSVAGALAGIEDRELKRQLVDATAPWGFGQFIHERVADRNDLQTFQLNAHTRIPWSGIRVDGWTDGPVWSSVQMTGMQHACADSTGIRCELRLYKPEKRMELRYTMRKLPVVEAEAVYVALPFAVDAARLLFEAQGGMVEAGRGQVEGSSMDWAGVQNQAVVRSRDAQVVVVSPEIPLMMFGDIHIGKFMRMYTPERPHLYSWVLNNYWTTNFVAKQEGEMNWRYVLTSSADTSDTFATRFGWGVRVPFLTRVLPAGAPNGRPAERSFLELGNERILLVAARPMDDGAGVILHLRETGGHATTLDLGAAQAAGMLRHAREVNVLGEPKGDDALRFEFRSHETKFIEVRRDR